MWSIAPVPLAPPCEVRPRYFFWFSPAIFALGPMCTMSTLAEVHPVHREAEVRVRPARHAEDARVPVARRIDVVGRDQEVLDVRKRHALIYNDVHLGCQAPQRSRARARSWTRRSRARREARHRRHRRDRRRRRPPACCSSAWTAASSTPCIRRPPRRCARRPTSAAPARRARSARRSTPRTRSASRSPPARSAGPRWKAAAPIMVGGECIGGVGVAGGNWEFDERVAREAAESIKR